MKRKVRIMYWKVAEKHILNDLIVSWMCECVYDIIYFLRERGAWKAENWRANK